ncbi:hypothetical protein F4802DRAFT_609466 [Xylaria palmicola]|nr:hypothetical protein F4802DRAFT_609466 [Xylaria palmicola]
MVSSKGKEKESVASTWPVPSDVIVPSGSSTHQPNLSRSVFAQPSTSHGSLQPSTDATVPEVNFHDWNHSSKTWTSSSENPDPPWEGRRDDREQFVREYNRLAERHGIRLLVPGDFPYTAGHIDASLPSRRSSWLSKMLRQGSEQATTTPDTPSLRHQRSLSDAALNFIHTSKPDGLKNQDLRALVRLCSKSSLFLPTDYAPFSLTLPTCFRALAQALAQHADTKGLFRIPGSARVVNALYDYYGTDGNTDAISSTTRCPTLPPHIKCNPHDIASTFKRFLAGLPGGILGSLLLFDALVAIHSRFQGDAELHWSKQSKLRARLIALAIGTIKSQYQRELICAVFGLLCLDGSGRPLPTTDLMGYNALGIVFGPLLVGDLINDYSMRVANPSAGLVLLPVSSPRSRKERHKHKHKHKPRRRHRRTKRGASNAVSPLAVDKVHIANSITEMLIVHWREVVRQIRNIRSAQSNIPNNLPSSAAEHVSMQNTSRWTLARRRSSSLSTTSPEPMSFHESRALSPQMQMHA